MTSVFEIFNSPINQANMKRRKFIIHSSLGMLATIPSMDLSAILDVPYFTTGIKIGEISPTSAII